MTDGKQVGVLTDGKQVGVLTDGKQVGVAGMSLMGIYLEVITSYMHMGQFMLYLLRLWQVCLLLEITGE